MDIDISDRPPIRQATEDDLHGVLAAGFGATVALVRNYGDRFQVTRRADGSYRLAYYEAVTGRWQEAAAPLSLDQVKDAFLDYFQGNWNWHPRHEWRTM